MLSFAFASASSAASANGAPAASGSRSRSSVMSTPNSRIVHPSQTPTARSAHTANTAGQLASTPLQNRGTPLTLGTSHAALSHPCIPGSTSVGALVAEVERDPTARHQLFQAIAPLSRQQVDRVVQDMLEPAVRQGVQGALAEMREEMDGHLQRMDQIEARQNELQARHPQTRPVGRFRRQTMNASDNSMNALATRVEDQDPEVQHTARVKLLRKFKPNKAVRRTRREGRMKRDAAKRIAALRKVREDVRVHPEFNEYEEERNTWL
ncbi:hypothetical protein BCR44DRAFT_1449050, partial [Catenaria anguillulae PL171]